MRLYHSRTRHKQSSRVRWASCWSRAGQSCDGQLMVDWRMNKDRRKTSP